MQERKLASLLAAALFITASAGWVSGYAGSVSDKKKIERERQAIHNAFAKKLEKAGYSEFDYADGFYTKYSDGSENCGTYSGFGCGIVYVVSESDCSNIFGSMKFTDDSENIVETVTNNTDFVSAGEKIRMQFDETKEGSSHIELMELRCEVYSD